jgi:hypothetical protein
LIFSSLRPARWLVSASTKKGRLGQQLVEPLFSVEKKGQQLSTKGSHIMNKLEIRIKRSGCLLFEIIIISP